MRVRAMRLAVLGFLLALGTDPAAADETYDRCIANSDGTTTAWQQCGTAYIEREEARLNNTLSLAVKSVAGLERTRADLQAEQERWNAYAQKACEAFRNGDWGRVGQVLQFVKCRTRVLADRVAALEAYFESPDSDGKPAALPVPPPVVPPIAGPRTASATQAPIVPGPPLLGVLFPADAEQVPKEAEAELRQLAEKLKGTSERIALRAFASGDDIGPARRKALTRAISVRRFLGDEDLAIDRVFIRFLGQATDGEPADRVDIHLLGP